MCFPQYVRPTVAIALSLSLASCGGSGGSEPVPNASIDAADSDTVTRPGNLTSGSTTDDNTPRLSGSLSAPLAAGQKVQVYDGDSALAPLATVTGKQWSFTPTFPLAEGEYRFRVAALAADGRAGAQSAEFVLKIAVVFAARLPHSGITSAQCYKIDSNDLASCSSAEAISLSGAGKQDGMRAGSSALSYSSVGGFSKEECVKDNVTGLIWEGKTTEGLRAGTNTYSNRGDSLQSDSGGYVAAVNAIGLCGYRDWRMPTLDELQSLVDYSIPRPGPTINAVWFPNTSANPYWSSESSSSDPYAAWTVYFDDGGTGAYTRNSFGLRRIRLVRSAS